MKNGLIGKNWQQNRCSETKTDFGSNRQSLGAKNSVGPNQGTL